CRPCPVFFFQAEDGIRDFHVTGVQTCALPILQPSLPISNRSFAIIVDSRTYQACEENLQAYREAIEKQGLPTYIIHEQWASPARSEERRVGKEWRSWWKPGEGQSTSKQWRRTR